MVPTIPNEETLDKTYNRVRMIGAESRSAYMRSFFKVIHSRHIRFPVETNNSHVVQHGANKVVNFSIFLDY